jgi:hypothetical protein
MFNNKKQRATNSHFKSLNTTYGFRNPIHGLDQAQYVVTLNWLIYV